MPDLVTHYCFGKKVYENLNNNIKNHISSYDLYAFTTAGPDPFFFYKFLNGEENKKIREFGNYMHRNKTREFFINTIKRNRISTNKDLLFSYLAGFITHYALDSNAHPFIFHKTGEYLYNEETLKYRGLHTKLERAIDSYYIRKNFNCIPWKFKISKQVLTLKKLPLELKDDLNDIYLNTYDFPNIFKVMDVSLKSQIKFYNFIYDPTGFKNWLFSKIDNGKGGIDFSKLSYYKKELPGVDIFNEQHHLWTNPVDETITTNVSFFEIFETAVQMANELINISYQYIYENQEVDLDYYFKNLSYLTGVDTSLPYKDDMKYFNNIFAKENE